ncbi:hypothetical protein SERLADRAFT_475141 [Serpula lacrymans var. lacrymans S7.9]|uniref:Major facilitator superfamily (MFS) profile domain-containing protein n=1 Tax=Serpula lacrymans var. lacrymans (strain S7.9) TaxID=578457 RepID=F8P5Y6_SERL9|nr:uncharacterized protein SERLADRAFT_475141 [Serpula lacrymans var. lacrymans S7.9]EGO22023.1 hypothetical protein SERLADRAFT_475141 [Serpula lacrymans var. lacrymans S7.9]
MSSEESPLLHSENQERDERRVAHLALYSRFSESQKRTILSVVSLAGLLPLFVAGSFIPSIPQIARDLNSTGAIVSLAVSLSIFSTAIGSLFWASNSTFYGRRPIYLYGLPLLCIGSVGVAVSSTLKNLLFWRVVQAFGSSGGLSLGSGVIGDIYQLEERGTAMGIFFGACLLGPALAPLAGGTAAEYASWRTMQLILGVWGLIEILLVFLFLPETSHPGTRGKDKIPESERGRFKLVNPLDSLWLLRSPNLLAISIASGLVLLTDFVLLVPLAYTIGVRYHIENQALIGACFLSCGLGNLIGAPLAGRLSDKIIKVWKIRRKGEWVPEDRLRAAWVGALYLVPLSVLFSGLITTYVDGPLGLTLSMVCLFFHGLGVKQAQIPALYILIN